MTALYAWDFESRNRIDKQHEVIYISNDRAAISR